MQTDDVLAPISQENVIRFAVSRDTQTGRKLYAMMDDARKSSMRPLTVGSRARLRDMGRNRTRHTNQGHIT